METAETAVKPIRYQIGREWITIENPLSEAEMERLQLSPEERQQASTVPYCVDRFRERLARMDKPAVAEKPAVPVQYTTLAEVKEWVKEKLIPGMMGAVGKGIKEKALEPLAKLSHRVAALEESFAKLAKEDKSSGLADAESLDIDVEQSVDDPRGFSIKVHSRGRTTTRSFTIPSMLYCGVFDSSAKYVRGDCVTSDGAVWVCRVGKTSSLKPGPASGGAWQLAVKAGRDGRERRE